MRLPQSGDPGSERARVSLWFGSGLALGPGSALYLGPVWRVPRTLCILRVPSSLSLISLWFPL